MSIFNLKSDIRVTCAAKTGHLLETELRDLGFWIHEKGDNFVEVKGTLHDCMKLNLWLRTAWRVMFLLDAFEAENPDDLYEQLQMIPWEEYIPADGYLTFESYVENDSIKDKRFAHQKAKDAIVDHISSVKGRRPDSGPERIGVVLFLYWRDSDVQVYIDTSGEALNRRGYRVQPWVAPMQETLAASVLMSALWLGNKHFINPMCGSGTIAIEAALMATKRAPGVWRPYYSFMHLVGFVPVEWQKMQAEAHFNVKDKLDNEYRIIASDISPKAIKGAIVNAKRVKVDHMIEFYTCPFEETPMPGSADHGIVLINPPYGERMGEEEELIDLYKGIGDFFKQKCAGKTGYVFTGNPDLAKVIGLKPALKWPFMNGKIECRLLKFELYEGTKRTVFKTA